jgi:hypothetical protein
MVNNVNSQAYSILLPSDWMVVKAIETGSTVPADWNTWRQTIRTQAADAAAIIEACTTVDQLAALPSVPWTPDPDQAAALAAQEAAALAEQTIEQPGV